MRVASLGRAARAKAQLKRAAAASRSSGEATDAAPKRGARRGWRRSCSTS